MDGVRDAMVSVVLNDFFREADFLARYVGPFELRYFTVAKTGMDSDEAHRTERRVCDLHCGLEHGRQFGIRENAVAARRFGRQRQARHWVGSDDPARVRPPK